MDTKGIFAEQICNLREKSLRERKDRNPNKAIATWIEDDRLIKKQGKAFVIILNSKGCKWGLGKDGGCSMCGYSNETSSDITAENLIKQFLKGLEIFEKKEFQSIKIFNSGSFLDEIEIPIEAQNGILSLINDFNEVTEVIIESRPEFVQKSVLKRLKSNLNKDKELEIGIGLESSNDFIRINNINKGFLFNDFVKAVDIAIKEDIRVKTYLLMKPPFLTEKEAIDDIVQSTLVAIKLGSRSISINPVNIQTGTFVYYLWRNDIYHPPWFWSLKEAIQRIWFQINKENLENKVDRIVSDPSSSGLSRSIHNCRKCNRDFARAIQDYSLKQEAFLFDSITCSCYDLWKELIVQEEASRDFSLMKVEKAEQLL